jgi:replicative DNA helicase
VNSTAKVRPIHPNGTGERADIAAERKLLGGVLLTPGAILDVEGIVQPEDFHVGAHGLIFAAALACHEQGIAIDEVTVPAMLRTMGKLDEVGEPRVMQLLNGVSDAAHVEAHARLIANHAVARRVEVAARSIATKARDHRCSVEDLSDFASEQILTATERRTRGEAVPLSVAVEEKFESLSQSDVVSDCISTGFEELDRLTDGGFRPSELIVLAARPRVGKSLLSMQIARHVARSRHVLVFALEMNRGELLDRMLASESRTSFSAIRSKRIESHNMQSVIEAANVLHALPVDIDDAHSLQIGELRARARRCARRKPLGLIVVDYLQLVAVPKAESREQAVATIARGLKALAKELNVPVLALSQINRAGKDKPSIEHLRESGEVEQTANTVMLLHREELVNKKTEHKGIAILNLAKQRNGPSEVEMELRFTGHCVRFDNPQPDSPHAQDTRAEEWSGFDAE